MKKLTIILALLLLIPLSMAADTFASLWEKYEKAQEKDLPKTQIAVLQQIQSKALKTLDYGQLLKAQLIEVTLKASVAPDSLPVDMGRLKEKERQALQTNAVLAAVYESVLGRLYREYPYIDEQTADSSKAYYKRSMRNPELLAQHTAAEYKPLLVEGVDSKMFYNDLLHVIGFEAGDFATLHRYYKEHGNRNAECYCAFRMAQKDSREEGGKVKKSKYLQTLDSLISEYKDLTTAGEIAIERYNLMDKAEDVSVEDQVKYINYALLQWGAWPRMNILRNALTQLTLPSFQVDMGNGVQRPGAKRNIPILSLCNIQELTITVTRVNLNGDTELNLHNVTDYAKIKKVMAKEAAFSLTKRYVGLPNYQVMRDTMTVDELPVGVYLVEFTTNNAAVHAERALLRVSDIFVINQVLPNDSARFVVINATSGRPVPYAKIRLKTYLYSAERYTIKDFRCNELGEAYTFVPRRQSTYVYASTDDDRYAPEMSFQGSYNFYDYKQNQTIIPLFTDRRIYRPGQTVHISAVAFRNIAHERNEVLPGQELTLTLKDANYKTVEQKTVTTDSYGTASTDFVLPASGLTGNFSIRTHNSSVSFSVEEYKRPTFQVEFDKVKAKYQAGDTVTVRGVAKSFAGVPVQGARVKYTIRRRPRFLYLWRGHSNRDMNVEERTDSAVTDNEGAFQVKVLMNMPERDKNDYLRYYAFDIDAQVTDVSGESRDGSTSLPLSDKPTAFSCGLPQRIERDSLRNVIFNYMNNAGENIAAEVRYTVDGTNVRTAKTNETTAINADVLASGRHVLEAICGNDTLKQEFVIFTIADKKPAIVTDDWFYQSGDAFVEGRPVYVQMGTSYDNQHVVYTIVSGNRLLESGTFDQSNAITTRRFTYRKEYGDGILLTCAWVKDGKLYEHTAAIRRVLPSDKLNMEWRTFRDRLVPGQKETWSLRITKPDGTPADAQMMAVLYDKSLDMLQPHAWNLNANRYLVQPHTNWYALETYDMSLYGEMSIKYLNEKSLSFTGFDEAIFNVFMRRSVAMLGNTRARKKLFSVKAKGNDAIEEEALKDVAAVEKVMVRGVAASKSNAPKEPMERKAVKADQVRENLNETAFFYPALQTDKDGCVEWQFTLPESITTWRFMALSHDKDMNNGSINAEAVAKKTVMIQPNMPRFVRTGDKGMVSARLFNTSEKAVTGMAKLELIDPETDKTVYQQSCKYKIEPNGTAAVSFDFDASSYPSLLIARTTAMGKGYSDGEQHYLPVLSDRELVLTTVPFTQNGPGTKNIDLTRLFPTNSDANRLIVEYTNNPAWLMVQTLPSVALTFSNNAISQAVAYYANSIADNLLHSTPAIKTTIERWKQETGTATSLISNLQKNEDVKTMLLTETPWVLEANTETDQKQQLINFFNEALIAYRINNNISNLRSLQHGDGSFSWLCEMPGSMYLTTAVTKLLVRLNTMIGQREETKTMIRNAFRFMDREVAKRVNEMKKEEKKGEKNLVPSDVLCDYLYTNALAERPSTSDIRYLISLLTKAPVQLTIYGKANTAVILAQYGEQRHAKEYLQSLNEYTVYTEEMGRYFDTPKARYSWFDYKIPTQVAAIEAMKMLNADDRKTIEEMQRWLLQAKRTQSWDTPLNAADAVYAFMSGQMDKFTADTPDKTALKVNGVPLALPQATAGLGYVKTSKTGKNMKTFTADKTSKGVSWGAVYAQFMQKTTDVADASSGLSVKREIIHSGKTLKVGDRVRIKITIEANRDYDFVQVQDKRAACLEPVNQLSGYHWGYYCAPKDNVTNYYFDQLRKGKHVIETEYYIDREGLYQTGTCTVQCAYAPEYSGRTAAKVLNVQ